MIYFILVNYQVWKQLSHGYCTLAISLPAKRLGLDAGNCCEVKMHEKQLLCQQVAKNFSNINYLNPVGIFWVGPEWSQTPGSVVIASCRRVTEARWRIWTPTVWGKCSGDSPSCRNAAIWKSQNYLHQLSESTNTKFLTIL